MKSLWALSLALILAACGTAAPQKPPPGDGFNHTDVMFAQMMFAHQATADTWLTIAGERAVNEEIRTLAAAVRVTQADEAKQVAAWLQQWNQPSNVDRLSEAHAAHGGLPSTGEAELEALTTAAPAEFDRTFLNIFIGHQHQAVEFARMELAAGANADAVALANRVDQSRRAQIELMLKLVGVSNSA